MSDQTKMYLKLAAFLAVAAGIGVGLFCLFFYNPTSVVEPPTPSADAGAGSLNPSPEGTTEEREESRGPSGLTPSAVADGGLTENIVLTTAAVVAPQASANGVAYYDPKDGRFYRLNNSGEAELLLDRRFPNAESVSIASDVGHAALEFPDGSNIVINLRSGEQYSPPNHWTDFNFTPDGQEFAAKSLSADANNRALIITSADGATTTVVAALGENASQVHISPAPNREIIAFSATGAGGSQFGQNTVYLVAPDGTAAGAIVVNGSNFKSLWSPNGQNFLYSVLDAGDNYQPSLWYSDKRGDRGGAVRLRLSLKTSANKCVFADATTAYCAAPKDDKSAGDSLFKVSFPSGRSDLLAQTVTISDINNLHLAPDGSQLFYTDQLGRLNMIRLR